MLKKMYDTVLDLANHKQAPLILFLVAFAESSVFPIPPDLLLIPMVLANINKAFKYALICTVGSVLGGIAGYAMGYFAFETFGQPIIDFYHAADKFAKLQAYYAEYDMLIVAAAGFSPIPYKIFTLFTGVVGASLPQFILASALSRGARFFLVAWLLWRGGHTFKGWIEAHLPLLTLAGTAVLVALVVLIKVIL